MLPEITDCRFNDYMISYLAADLVKVGYVPDEDYYVDYIGYNEKMDTYFVRLRKESNPKGGVYDVAVKLDFGSGDYGYPYNMIADTTSYSKHDFVDVVQEQGNCTYEYFDRNGDSLRIE